MEKRVVTQGGGDNLFKVSTYGDWYHVYQVDPGFLSNSYKDLGKTRQLKDALDVIRAYSGKEIASINDW